MRVSGDAETAQSFQKLFKAARPDFEEQLSRLVGDAAAHHMANVARPALDFGRRAIVVRKGKRFVINKKNPKFKQRQG